jgi:hypothetical protein
MGLDIRDDANHNKTVLHHAFKLLRAAATRFHGSRSATELVWRSWPDVRACRDGLFGPYVSDYLQI